MDSVRHRRKVTDSTHFKDAGRHADSKGVVPNFRKRNKRSWKSWKGIIWSFRNYTAVREVGRCGSSRRRRRAGGTIMFVDLGTRSLTGLPRRRARRSTTRILGSRGRIPIPIRPCPLLGTHPILRTFWASSLTRAGGMSGPVCSTSVRRNSRCGSVRTNWPRHRRSFVSKNDERNLNVRIIIP